MCSFLLWRASRQTVGRAVETAPRGCATKSVCADSSAPYVAMCRTSRVIGALFALLLVFGVIALVAVQSPPAHAAGLIAQTQNVAIAGKPGTITGQVVNGTLNNTPVANQPVILQFSQGTAAKDLRTVKTDAQGRFTFSDVTPTVSADQKYAVYTHFQNGLYASDPIQLSAGKTQSITLTVYNATQDASKLSVSVVTLLVRDVDQQHQLHGLVSIGEFVTFQNSGKTAFVGSFTPGASGMPPLLRFALPANATNVTTGIGFFNSQVIQINGGFATSATVPPGSTQFAFSFDAPYSGTTFTLPFTAEYPTAQVVALVPPDIFVSSSPGFQAQGEVIAFSNRYQVFTANTLAVNKRVSINMFELPKAGETSDLDTTQLTWLAIALAMLIAILLLFYLRSGDLAVALGLVPARTLKAARQAETTAKRLDRGQREAERKRLLKRLLALEKAHTTGALTDEEYRQKQAETRAALRSLLADELPASALATPAKKSKSGKSASAASGQAQAAEDAPTSGTPDEMEHAPSVETTEDAPQASELDVDEGGQDRISEGAAASAPPTAKVAATVLAGQKASASGKGARRVVSGVGKPANGGRR